MKITKVLSLITLVVMLLSCTISGASAEIPVTAQEDTITVAMVSEAAQLDPQGDAVTQPDAIINVQVYEGLFKLHPETGEVMPCLATSYEWVEDNVMRVHLRDDVYFHNGSKFTAEDVLFSVSRGVESASKEYSFGVVDIDNCKIVDEYTVDIATFGPYPALLADMLDNGWLMISKEYFESTDYAEFIRNPMGTGPWVFNEWIAGDSISMTRNENYWGEKPYFGNLVIRTITDDTTRALALETGEVDYVIEVVSSQVEYINEGEMATVQMVPGRTLEYITMNETFEPFADVRVRQAMMYAIDLPSMVQLAYGVSGSPADGIFFPGNVFYTPAKTTYAQDIEKAKALMEEAGYADGFTCRLIAKDVSTRVTMCEMLANAWSELNINVEISVMDIATYYSYIQSGDYDMGLGGFVCQVNDGDMYYDNFHSEASFSSNYAQYKNPKFDELADAGRFELDNEKRQGYYDEMQELLRQELPWLPLCFANEAYGCRNTLTGAYLYDNGIPTFDKVVPAA